MKSRLLLTSLAALLAIAPLTRLSAQTPADEPAPAEAAFNQLFEKISAKLKAGRTAEADFAGEIAGFDAIIAKAPPEDAAMISIMKARLYLELFNNPAQGLAILRQIKTDYPATEVAAKIDTVITAIETKLAGESALAVGAAFPAFSETDLDGKTLDLASYKGKVVLIDFWATWCGPCVDELPNVIAAYEKYHARGFEIIGISLDKNRGALDAFIKEHRMTWRHYFDGLGWQNKVSTRYGIDSIPATFLLDGEGRIVAKGLRGDALDQKLATLLK